MSIPYVTLVTQKSGEPSDSLWFQGSEMSSNKNLQKTWHSSGTKPKLEETFHLQQKEPISNIPISRYTGLFNLVSTLLWTYIISYCRLYVETPFKSQKSRTFIQKQNQKKQREKSTNQYKIKQSFSIIAILAPLSLFHI